MCGVSEHDRGNRKEGLSPLQL